MKSPRQVALNILIRVEGKRGRPDILLDDAFKRHRSLTDLDRAFITELVYGTLRWQGKIDWVIDRLSRFKIERMERVILCILRLGVYQLLFLTKTPDRAAVHQSVTLAKKHRRGEIAGFVNALLRRVIRERDSVGLPTIKGTPQQVLAFEQAFPLWAIEKLWDYWGEVETRAFCEASNQIAPLTLRANTLKTDRPSLMDRFTEEGLSVSPTAFSPEGVTFEEAPPVSKIPFIKSGFYQIQDEAAQLIAHLVDPKPGERILDACAAPGTKTTHLAQLMGNRGEIFAIDIDGGKLRLLREICKTMGFSIVTVLKRDAAQPLSLPGLTEFDAILVDAPCTGWGTIRRNPDIKWRRDYAAIGRMASLQRRILDNLAGYLRKKGRMIYSTCTVHEEENENVIDGFLLDNGAFCLDRSEFPSLPKALFDEKRFFRTVPHRHGMDGFFAARLIKS